MPSAIHYRPPKTRKVELRPCQQRFQLGNPYRLPLDQRRLLRQQDILLAVTQAIAKWQNHPSLDSHLACSRNRKLPTR
jgi:hypothetical protein